jgi:hypothetical protein
MTPAGGVLPEIAMHARPERVALLALTIAVAVGTASAAVPSPVVKGKTFRHGPGALASPRGERHPAPSRPATILTVTSCADDGGAGTLRNVVAGAVSGDQIDLSQLACSTISLANGVIATSVDDIAFYGPGDHVLTIDGNHADAVFASYGAGTLKLDHLAVVNGSYLGTGTAADGGCIYAEGAVALNVVTVSGCIVGQAGVMGYGGGIWSYTGATIESSTISGNSTTQIGGGLFSFGPIKITNSTVSGNTSDSVGAGVAAVNTVAIYSSTLADNAAPYGGGGLFVAFNAAPVIESTIIADNTRTDTTYYAADIGSPYRATTISGNGNLVQFSDMPLPAGTLDADPMLLPLAANGGPTMTQALAAASPAIDQGNNVAMLGTDQRGAPFTRVYGDNADIGAFELQPLPDFIFADGFDAAPMR